MSEMIDEVVLASPAEFFDDVEVELIDHCVSDDSVIRAARVSTLTDQDEHTAANNAGLIGYLMRNRHGSPFEHGSMTFRVKAPIFVFREHHRHRIGHSYNEQSARYREMLPEFYVPKRDRPMRETGTSANPSFDQLDDLEYGEGVDLLMDHYRDCWDVYQGLLRIGWAKEMARAALPFGIFSSMYTTCNARSIMNFLGLRVHEPDAMFVSKPQWEIQLVAKKMEAIWAELMPITHEHFVKNGRVSP